MGMSTIAGHAASELHLRPDGPQIVEWKLVSAEATHDSSAWAKTPRKKFPPPGPRATDARAYGFVKP
jgi:hypothetical protein